jgi:hypothetical protein
MASHVKHLSGGGDLTLMLNSAKQSATVERTIRISEKAPAGRTEFLALVGNDGKVTGMRFLKGSESLQSLGSVLRGERYPIEFPSAMPVRLPLDLAVFCVEQKGCMVGVALPRRGILDK